VRFFTPRLKITGALVLALLATSCDTWDLPINEKLEFYRSVVAVGSWEELKTLAEDPNAPAILAVAKDITFPAGEASIIYVTRTLTIISFEGTHTISRGQGTGTAFVYEMFHVSDGGDLTLGGYAGKTLILDGGAIWNTDSPPDNDGVKAERALINVYNAHLTIHDGTILRNNHNIGGVSEGGGVDVYGNGGAATVTMTGGTISGNTSGVGGGVRVCSENTGGSAKLTMKGGAISGNTATSTGGGVYVNGSSDSTTTLAMTGGAISGNTSDYRGGGVYAISFTANTTAVTMTGGVISGNTASDEGGGVFVFVYPSSEAVFEKANVLPATTSGIIYGNDADPDGLKNTASTGHAVYVHVEGSPSTFKKRDATAGEYVPLDSDDDPGTGGWDPP
jgi:hypothetical protein